MRAAVCPICGNRFEKCESHFNRALRMALNVYCSRKCMGISKRKNRTDAEKKKIKQDYDRIYRAKHVDRIKKNKREYFKRTYNKQQAAVHRKERMPYHVAYCRRPAYRVKKKEYDVKRVAKRNYGEMWECSILLKELRQNIDNRLARDVNQLNNKTQKRKRVCKTRKQALQQQI